MHIRNHLRWERYGYMKRSVMLVIIMCLIALLTGCAQTQPAEGNGDGGHNEDGSLVDGMNVIIKNSGTGRFLNTRTHGMVDHAVAIQLGQSKMLDEVWTLRKASGGWHIQNAMTGRFLTYRDNEAGSVIEVATDPTDNSIWLVSAGDDRLGAVSITTTPGDLALGFSSDDITVANEPLLVEYSAGLATLEWSLVQVALPENCPVMLPLEGDLFHSSCPQIIKEGDTYYLIIMAPGIVIKESKDLVNWKATDKVFPRGDPSWLADEVPGYGIWAPSCYKMGDLYYTYYCISTIGKQNSAIGVAMNKTLDRASPEYKWEDLGMVLRSHTGDLYNAIDPNIAFDDDGRVWLTFGSYWNGLYQMEVDADTGLLKNPDAEPIHIAKRIGDNGAIEAPYIIKRNGYYYLFTAFNPMNLTYHNRVGRSEGIHGPYIARDGNKMLNGAGTIVTKGLLDLTMPGHASVFFDDGRHYLVGEYFRTNSPSILFISTIEWDDDGWPISALTPDIYRVVGD